MSSIHPESLSSFGRQAVKLDTDFAELERLSGQIQRLDIETDSGLERAMKLLEQFSQHGQNLSGEMQEFSRFLHEAREKSEAAAKQVADRAQAIIQRRQQQNGLREKLARVEENVQTANAGLSNFRKEGPAEFSAQEKAQIAVELERLGGELKRLLADAQAVKDEAAGANFRTIERDAQNLVDVLRSSSRRIEKAIPQV